MLKDGCWGLMYICRLSIDAVVDSGACAPLVKLLMHSSDDVCCVALEALSAIFGNGNVHHKRKIIDYQVLPRLRYLLHSRRERTREIACTALANIARSTPELLESLRHADVFLSLINIVSRKATTRGGWLTWREAVRALCATIDCARTGAQDGPAKYLGTVKYLVGHGLIFALRQTVNEAAHTSMELCMDPALRIVELLIEAGDDEERQMMKAQCLAEAQSEGGPLPLPTLEAAASGGESDATPPGAFPGHARTADASITNPYKQFIADVGLAETMSFAYLAKIWKSGYPKGKCNDALPGHLERLCARVQSLVGGSTKVPSLQSMSRQVLRRHAKIHLIQRLPIADELKAYIMGLSATDVEYVGGRHTCSIEEALEMKEQGDRHFIGGFYAEAATSYSQALDKINESAIEALKVTLLLNRSAAFLKLELFDAVLEDCNNGLRISPFNTKCLQRRAAAYERTGQHQKALEDYVHIKGDESEAAQHRLRTQLGLEVYPGHNPAPAPSRERGNSAACQANNCRLPNPPRQSPQGMGSPDGSSGGHQDKLAKHDDADCVPKEFSFATLRSLRAITHAFLRADSYS